MAERIQVELVDDIDGSRAQHTVTFALDGVTYEIDLSERHARDLRSVFARYIDHARTTEQEKPRTTKQQEREDKRVRQENRQLTEQIRGAAQRSRERVKQDEPASGRPEEESAGDSAGPVEDELTSAPAPSPGDAPAAGAGSEREDGDRVVSGETDEEGAESRWVPSVSLPQFSSASD